MGTKMGTPPAVDPVPAGNACANQWGMGKAHGDLPTPSAITVTISGIEQGPNWNPGMGEAPEGTFILTQKPGVPCTFLDVPAPNTEMGVIFNLANTVIQLLSSTQFGCFHRTSAVPGITVFSNDEVLQFVGGTATIIFPEIS